MSISSVLPIQNNYVWFSIHAAEMVQEWLEKINNQGKQTNVVKEVSLEC